MQASEKVWGLCTVIVGGLLVSLLYHITLDVVFGVGYPSNTFIFRPHLMFSDFFDIFRSVQKGNPLGEKWSVYFPFAYIPLYPLVWLSPVYALGFTILLFSLAVFWFFWSYLSFLPLSYRALASGILSFSTYPFIFCVARGNLEMIVLLFVFVFVFYYRCNMYLIAAAFLSCAIAMKLYPGVLGVLLLKKRQYKASALTAALTLALTLISASIFPGGVAKTAELLKNNLEIFREEYILDTSAIYFSSSYFTAFKFYLRVGNYDFLPTVTNILLPYRILCVFIFASTVFYVIRYEEVLWKQVALLSFNMILLPEVSYDYKLIHLLIPIGLFIRSAPDRLNEDRLNVALFGLLLIPKAYAPVGFESTISLFLNPLLMTAIMVHIVWRRARTERQPLKADT